MKKLIGMLILAVVGRLALAQTIETATTFEVSSYDNKSYVAKDYVLLKDGFQVSAAQDGDFFARNLEPPANLEVTGTTSSSVSLSWDAAMHATSYVVKAFDVMDVFNPVGVISGISATSYTFANLTHCKKYLFIVTSQRESITSSSTSSIRAITNGASQTPTASDRVFDESSVNLFWTSVACTDKYEILLSEDPDFSNLVSGYDPLVHDVHNHSTRSSWNYDANQIRTSCDKYYYKVRAVLPNGSESDYSNVATISSEIPDFTFQHNGEAQYTLTVDGIFCLSSFELDVAYDDEFSSFVPGYNSKVVSGTSYVLNDLEKCQTYYFRVRGIYGQEVTGNSPVKSIQTPVQDLLVYDPDPTLITLNPFSFVADWIEIPCAEKYVVTKYVPSNSGMLAFEVYSGPGTVVDGVVSATINTSNNYSYYQVKAYANGYVVNGAQYYSVVKESRLVYNFAIRDENSVAYRLNSNQENAEAEEADSDSKNSFGIFPNPFSNQLTLRIDNENIVERVAILNLSGKTILQVLNIAPNQKEVILEPGRIEKGVYILMGYQGDQKVFSEKIIKE